MRASRYWFSLVALLAFGAAICALGLVLHGHGFNEFDMSPMIDSGWRVYSGQIPGRDFLVTFPPSLYLLTALFFRMFGVTWRALGIGGVLVYAAMLLLGLRVSALLRRSHGEQTAIWTACAYVAGLTLPYVIMNVV